MTKTPKQPPLKAAPSQKKAAAADIPSDAPLLKAKPVSAKPILRAAEAQQPHVPVLMKPDPQRAPVKHPFFWIGIVGMVFLLWVYQIYIKPIFIKAPPEPVVSEMFREEGSPPDRGVRGGSMEKRLNATDLRNSRP